MHTEGCQWPIHMCKFTYAHANVHNLQHVNTHLQHTCSTLESSSPLVTDLSHVTGEGETAPGLPLCAAQRMLSPSHPPLPPHLSRHVSLSVTLAACSHFCPPLHLKSCILSDFNTTSLPVHRLQSNLYVAFEDVLSKMRLSHLLSPHMLPLFTTSI